MVKSGLSDRLPDVVALADEVFITGRGRTGSVAVRYPHVWNRENLPNIVATFDDGRAVSCAVIRYFEHHNGSTPKRSAMVGFVATRDDARGRGYSAEIMRRISRRLADEECSAFLWTSIPLFYRKFGWRVSDDRSVIGALTRSVAENPRRWFRVLPPADAPDSAEAVRRNAGALVLRGESEYRATPVPFDSCDLILSGESEAPDSFGIIGRMAGSLYVVDFAGSPKAARDLAGHLSGSAGQLFLNDCATGPFVQALGDAATWQPKSLRMTLGPDEPGHIPFFDRI